ncbi:3-oxoacyl-[acyl-carrier-protein] synthase 1 (3-oxoacyl-[acyl-carrier-protein] synthase I) (Beta-ketoacyl-ACP synthase I) (KAS I) [Durusdinium trenchii]|uniref:3-oxoacyl-[acyl-carrier-protein] synthase 1 n=1 Tax=Durusdinium trenchii TaxID=1381693 RepID=A0ABP0J759_9DINO
MGRIVAYNVPAYGHINPSLPVVEELVRRGEEVIFFNHESFRDAIERTGATFRPIENYIGHHLGRNRTFVHLVDALTRQSLAYMKMGLKELEELGEVDLVLHDCICPWGRFLADLAGIPRICLSSTLAMHKSMLLSGASPANIPYLITNGAGAFFRYLKTRRALKREFHLDALDPFSLLTNHGTDNIVFTSSEFQPRRELFDERYTFIGPSVNADEDPQTLIDYREAGLPEEPLIFASLGTVFTDLMPFYKGCLEAFADIGMPVVMVVGKSMSESDFDHVPDNFYIRSFVPQLRVLQHAKLFITHGGTNSVSESLYSGVPVMVLPPTAEHAFVGRAAAIQGAGLVMRQRDVAADRLRALADQVMGDPSYTESAQRMGDSFRNAGGFKDLIMSRVVVTGMGIVSSIGNDCPAVTASLRDRVSGIVHVPEMGECGFRTQIAAPVRNFVPDRIPADQRDQLSIAAHFALQSALEALEQAGLQPHDELLQSAGVVIGTGGGGQSHLPKFSDDAPLSISPEASLVALRRLMNSTAAAAVATHCGATGPTLSLSAGCATGLFNIGHAYRLIRDGRLECCLCGGAEEETWRRIGVTADNTSGMPTEYNDNPTAACRPFEKNRCGFVISEGGAVLVLESLESARRREAPILAEIVGYFAANDGEDLFVASGVGMRSVVRKSLEEAAQNGCEEIEYINAHATGTPVGDQIEARTIREIFGSAPAVSSSKGQTGHSQGAAGAQEAVYTLIMMRDRFIAPTFNLEEVAEECDGIGHVVSPRETEIATALTMNNGLGGTNASLIFRRITS